LALDIFLDIFCPNFSVRHIDRLGINVWRISVTNRFLLFMNKNLSILMKKYQWHFIRRSQTGYYVVTYEILFNICTMSVTFIICDQKQFHCWTTRKSVCLARMYRYNILLVHGDTYIWTVCDDNLWKSIGLLKYVTYCVKDILHFVVDAITIIHCEKKYLELKMSNLCIEPCSSANVVSRRTVVV
jgi:hypothetical protein